MNIRKTETVNKYKESKKFVEEYENLYYKTLASENSKRHYIWELKKEIQYLHERIRNQKPKSAVADICFKQIETRRKWIKKLLRELKTE